MYPAKLGIAEAKSRINRLIVNEHYAEALLTVTFTFEKTIHRTLKQLIVSSGFQSSHSQLLLKNVRGFRNQVAIWECFDPNGRTLPDLINSTNWQHVAKAVNMRNNLVHGSRVYDLDDCHKIATQMLALIDETVAAFQREYGYDGWSRVAVRRKSKLHSDPRVTIHEAVESPSKK